MAAAIYNKTNAWKLPLKFVRWNSKLDVKHPKPPSWERANFLAVSRPIYSPDPSPPAMKCGFIRNKKKTERDAHQYEKLVAKIIRDNFDKHEFIGVFHCNRLIEDESFQVKKLFYKAGMTYTRYPTELTVLALENTKFRPILQFSECLELDCFVFCEKPDIKKFLNITKKASQLILICGILEDRILSKNDLIAYSKLPDLQGIRAQLCNTLSAAGLQTVQNINFQATNLVQMLNQHTNQEKSEQK